MQAARGRQHPSTAQVVASPATLCVHTKHGWWDCERMPALCAARVSTACVPEVLDGILKHAQAPHESGTCEEYGWHVWPAGKVQKHALQQHVGSLIGPETVWLFHLTGTCVSTTACVALLSLSPYLMYALAASNHMSGVSAFSLYMSAFWYASWTRGMSVAALVRRQMRYSVRAILRYTRPL